MNNIYLTACALVISILVNIIFYSKKRINNIETKIYSYIIMINIFEAIITTTIVVVALKINNTMILKLLNRFDVIALITWCSLMYYYILNVSNDNNVKKYIKILIIVFNLINYFFASVLNVTIINSNRIMNSEGPLTNFALFVSAIYIVLMIFTIIINNKKMKFREVKYIPIYILILLLIVIAFLRTIIPEINFISIILSFVILIMYFTIENPDLKLIEEIKQSKDKSDQINADKSAFIFNIIQEVKNRSTEMNEYINESLTYDNINDIKPNLYKLQASLDRANKTINQTLDISEEDIIKIEKIDNKYNINNLIKEVTLRAKSNVKEEVDFRITIDNNIPEILYGDSVKIKQILTTILENAIKYTAKGFIELRIDSIIKYEVCRLLITLEDSGSGMDGETISEIFSQNTNNEYISKNLTLNSVNKIISLIGGTFNITSKVNHGTKITITVDQNIPEEEVNNNKVTEYVKELKIPKVLLVDENVKKLEKTKRMFKNENIYVDYVIIGEQCLRKIRNNEKFDLIIMDYEIPKINGLEVYSKLKEEGYNIPVIITTDSEDEKVKEKYKYFGVYDVIKNPIKKKDIKEIIEYLKNNQK